MVNVMMDDLEQKISKTCDIQKDILKFQHIYNPLHYYSRLRELGIDKDYAKELCTKYEKYIYSVAIKYIEQNEVKK